MKKSARAALTLGALIGVGWVLKPVEAGLQADLSRAWSGSAPVERDEGLARAVLGGFRGVTADALWLEAYATWERRDWAATETWLNLTTTVDPRPLAFWLTGARIIAYDIPVWRIEVEGAAESGRIIEEQARRALQRLAQAREVFPRTSAIWIEMGNIELNRRHDLEAAAADYRRAAEMPDAPFFAARIHGELLRRLGRKREALAWLERIYPTLPRAGVSNDREAIEEARADVVWERIEALRRDLGDETARDKNEAR